MTRPAAPAGTIGAAHRGIVALLRAGEALAALEASRLALAERREDPSLHALAATAALQAGRPAEAAAHAQSALEARDGHVPTLLLLGHAQRGLKNYRQAAAAFSRAAQGEPDAPVPLFLLCATRLQAGDPEAAAMLDGLLTRFPDDARGWEEIGTVLSDLGKPAAALACFTRALRARPSAALALRTGTLLKESGRLAEAATAFRQAADLDARSVRARFLLGLCLQDTGDGAGEAEAYRAALALDPTLAEAAVNLGIVLQDQGDLEAAKRAYAQALTARADTFGRIAQAITTARRGELWLDLGRLRRALAG